MKIIKSLIQKVRESYNKDINVIISDKHNELDFSLFGTRDVILYPKGTKIGRILIDTGLAKSWAEVNGSHWKNYEIPWGFTDLYLDGLSIWNKRFWGKRPHRLTILQWED